MRVDDKDAGREHADIREALWLHVDGDIVRAERTERVRLCSAAEIPITLDGAALHNVANAMGAAAMTCVSCWNISKIPLII